MKQHRIIWLVTGVVVLLAGIILAVRDARAPAISPPRPTGPLNAVADKLTPAQIELVIETMHACLEQDPQARRANTRALVEEVGDLAERGIHPTSDTYYALGLRRAGQRNYSGAEQAFLKSIELRPDWSWGYSGLGILYHSIDRLEEAEQAFRKTIELSPDWSRAHNDLAILLRLTGRLDEAQVHATRAIELDPDNVATHNNYGNLLVALERFDEAMTEYRKAIALEPDHPAPYYNLACVASLRGRHEEVVALLLCAIEFDPTYRSEATVDEDFDPVREDPAFQALIRAGS